MATVRDVALLAGVSPATVSRVLSGRTAVSADAQAKVLTAVKALDFQPNSMAQGLRLGRGTSVALLVGDIEQGVYAALTKHIQNALVELGLDLMLFNLGHREERLLRFLERAPSLRLRGVIIASSDVMPIAAIKAALLGRGGLLLSVGQKWQRHGVTSVVQGDRAAVAGAVRYLIDQGRAPVAYVGRIAGSVPGSDRFAGYRLALGQAGLAVDPALVWDVAYRYGAGYEALSRMIDAGTAVRGVQAGSDELALGAIAAIQDRGLRVPEDVAVVGLGNMEFASHTRPALTTLSEHPELIADKVREIIRSAEEGRKVPALSVIPRSLIRRQSA
ncbi:MAG TPA: LacI family DNA-binding transcriptional regulator [Roseomonas sp.]|jgi:DNA-binding LacI/PurR family transcriptional regulator